MIRRALMSLIVVVLTGGSALARDKWTSEQAMEWEKSRPWLVGCNFSPSTAANQLEMWQAETFDPATIDRELSWAEGWFQQRARLPA